MKTTVISPTSKNIEDIKNIFQENGFPRTDIYNSYIYRERDGRAPICSFYYSDDKLGGMYAVVPVKFKIGEEISYGYQSLDTMVDKDFRGKGLFQKTANDVYDYLSTVPGCLVYGFPNGNSYVGFKKYLDWNFLDPLPFIIRPINISFFIKNTYLRKLFSWLRVPVFNRVKGLVEYHSSFPKVEGIDELCVGFLKTYSVGVIRDVGYLESRYAHHPEKQYKYVISRDESTGLVNGLGIYCIENKHGGTVGYVMEVVHLPGRDDVCSAILSSILKKMYQQNCDCVLAWCFEHSFIYKSYKRHLFFNMPEYIRPIELHFGYRIIDKIDSNLVGNRRSWFLSYSDSDTV